VEIEGHGWIYNMEGLGSEGRFIVPGAIVYGATRSAVTYFTKGLMKEAKKTLVRVSFLNPGTVITDLLTTGDIEGSRRFLNAVTDRVKTVTLLLVGRILEENRHGARMNWLPRSKLAWRLASSPFSKRDPFVGKELQGGRA
jgi:short-subunit dehydrogenase